MRDYTCSELSGEPGATRSCNGAARQLPRGVARIFHMHPFNFDCSKPEGLYLSKLRFWSSQSIVPTNFWSRATVGLGAPPTLYGRSRSGEGQLWHVARLLLFHDQAHLVQLHRQSRVGQHRQLRVHHSGVSPQVHHSTGYLAAERLLVACCHPLFVPQSLALQVPQHSPYPGLDTPHEYFEGCPHVFAQMFFGLRAALTKGLSTRLLEGRLGILRA